MSSRGKIVHTFYIDLGSCGKHESQISDSTWQKVLLAKVPNFYQLTSEEKRRKSKWVRNIVYQALRRRYEERYNPEYSKVQRNISTWRA